MAIAGTSDRSKSLIFIQFNKLMAFHADRGVRDFPIMIATIQSLNEAETAVMPVTE